MENIKTVYFHNYTPQITYMQKMFMVAYKAKQNFKRKRYIVSKMQAALPV